MRRQWIRLHLVPATLNRSRERDSAPRAPEAIGIGLRRLALLVMIYVALDFADPMMPGAVQFVHGCLETVAGCGLRGGEAPMPIVAVPSRRATPDVVSAHSVVPSGRRVVSVSPPLPLFFRPPFEPSSPHPPSLDDD